VSGNPGASAHPCPLPCCCACYVLLPASLASLPGWSPNRRRKGSQLPLELSTAICAFFILEAATIFMALVIFPMFLMALMRCFTVRRESEKRKGGGARLPCDGNTQHSSTCTHAYTHVRTHLPGYQHGALVQSRRE